MTENPTMPLRVTLLQMPVSRDKDENIQYAVEKLRDLRRTDVAVLPEMFVCPYDMHQFAAYAETEDEQPAWSALAAVAKETGLYVVAGSVPERVGNQLYNTSLVFDRSGRVIAKHRKVHLFDIHIPGRVTSAESAVLDPGHSATTFVVGSWTVGLAICYDIRFPEFIRTYADSGVDVLILPAVFNTTTGEAHWRDLLRMRAVDYQFYVVGTAPAQGQDSPYPVWGHSLVTDPWGDIVIEAKGESTLLQAELSAERLHDIRSQLPLRQHTRRPYPPPNS